MTGICASCRLDRVPRAGFCFHQILEDANQCRGPVASRGGLGRARDLPASRRVPAVSGAMTGGECRLWLPLLPARQLPAAGRPHPPAEKGQLLPLGLKGSPACWCGASQQRYRRRRGGGGYVALPPALRDPGHTCTCVTGVRGHLALSSTCSPRPGQTCHLRAVSPGAHVSPSPSSDRPSSTCADLRKLLCSMTSRHRFFKEKHNIWPLFQSLRLNMLFLASFLSFLNI